MHQQVVRRYFKIVLDKGMGWASVCLLMNAPSQKEKLLSTEARLVTSVCLLKAQGLSPEAQRMELVLRLQLHDVREELKALEAKV